MPQEVIIRTLLFPSHPVDCAACWMFVASRKFSLLDVRIKVQIFPVICTYLYWMWGLGVGLYLEYLLKWLNYFLLWGFLTFCWHWTRTYSFCMWLLCYYETTLLEDLLFFCSLTTLMPSTLQTYKSTNAWVALN